jgi:hypothetical protein
MFDPCIPEVMEAFVEMNRVHKRELWRSRIIWREIKDSQGKIIQPVPVIDLLYKG